MKIILTPNPVRKFEDLFVDDIDYKLALWYQMKLGREPYAEHARMKLWKMGHRWKSPRVKTPRVTKI